MPASHWLVFVRLEFFFGFKLEVFWTANFFQILPPFSSCFVIAKTEFWNSKTSTITLQGLLEPRAEAGHLLTAPRGTLPSGEVTLPLTPRPPP